MKMYRDELDDPPAPPEVSRVVELLVPLSRHMPWRVNRFFFTFVPMPQQTRSRPRLPTQWSFAKSEPRLPGLGRGYLW